MKHYLEPLWLGTPDSATQFAAALDNIGDNALQEFKAFLDEGGDKRPTSRLLTVSGHTARISVRGPLTNSDNLFLNWITGATGYPEIREALIEAAADADVKNILLDISSPGGQASGVADTGDLVARINRDVKPVVTFTDGVMASAAYWLGAGASEVYASKAAIVGSIGVVMTHMESSRRLDKEGITATVIRAGKYKQLANGVEPLTDDAVEQLQGQANSLYEVFLSHVAESRGKPVDFVRTSMAEGREFLGANAMHAGLVDEILGFDAVMERMSAKNVDSRTNFNKIKDLGANMTIKTALTEADVAAMVAGVTLPSVEAQETTSKEGEQTETTPLEVTGVIDAVGVQAIVTTAENLEARSTTAAELPSGAEALLKEQLAQANTDLVASRVENLQMQGQIEALTAQVEGLSAIAKHSLGNMQVALGGIRSTLDGLAVDTLLQMHTQLSADFQARFKAGGVAATPAAVPQKASAPARDSRAAFQLAAATTQPR